MIRKLAHRRAVSTDYFDFLPNVQSDIRNAALRDFETQTDSSRKDKEKLKTVKEDANDRAGKGTDKAGLASAKASPRGKQWADGDWAAWEENQNAEATTKDADDAEKPDENKAHVSKKK